MSRLRPRSGSRTGGRDRAAETEEEAGPSLDEVTGLPDRSALLEAAEAAIRASIPTSSRAAVVFVGIDQLRDVNDSFGPDTGDLLLKAVAERLTGIDLEHTEVMRYEGAEFALVFRQLANVEMLEKICVFLVELLAPAFELDHDRLDIAANVGGAIHSDKYEDFDDLIADAHEALVRARDEGMGAWVVHDEIRRARHSTRIDESRMQRALDDDEFLLFYQPIVRLGTGEIIGAEALIRWKAPGATNAGIVYPHDFMPLLEKSGLAVPVGRWVLEEACRQVVAWARLFPDNPALFITVNLGPRQMAQADFRDSVFSAIESTGVQPWQLCLDITEAALQYNRNATWSALRELKDFGVKLGLDDFGTGVSSMSYLRELRVDIVRADRSFVAGIEHSPEDRAIIRHIVGLAHDLDLVPIAEGVENEAQVALLQELGVDLAQGFHFGRPEPAKDLTERIRPDGTPPPDDEWASERVFDYTPPSE